VTVPPAWHLGAACRGMDAAAFFPAKGDSLTAYAEARSVCTGCGVRPECLAEAILSTEVHGCWGGMSAKERLRLRKLLRAAPTYAERLPDEPEPEHPVTIRPADRVTLVAELLDPAEEADPADLDAAAELLGVTPDVIAHDLMLARPDPHLARRERAVVGTHERRTFTP
jgi:WhiB family redox-sensing transcriptional regulator